jgi:trehalose-6-phosphatase
MTDALPDALASWAVLGPALDGRRLVVFLDYDGTLTPIVARPELAVLDYETRGVDKGKAVRWLLDATGAGDAVPIYVGDDITDEDAFTAVRDRGLGVLVAELPRPTAARYTLRDPIEVRWWLERLAGLAR